MQELKTLIGKPDKQKNFVRWYINMSIENMLVPKEDLPRKVLMKPKAGKNNEY